MQKALKISDPKGIRMGELLRIAYEDAPSDSTFCLLTEATVADHLAKQMALMGGSFKQWISVDLIEFAFPA